MKYKVKNLDKLLFFCLCPVIVCLIQANADI